MPNLRKKILEKIFKEGVKSVDKRVLEDLFSKAKDKVYRFQVEPTAKDFIKKGWVNPEFSWNMNKGDPLGLYWAPSEKDLVTYIKGSSGSNSVSTKEYISSLVEGIKRPGSEDFITRKFPTYYDKDYREVVQTAPGNVLAKHKDLYRILAVMGLLKGVEGVGTSD